MMSLQERFQQYIEEQGLFSHDDRLLLTVSGGVDSMVMLSLFVAAGYQVGVAHCNFQLRGRESDEDEVLVAEVEDVLNRFPNLKIDTHEDNIPMQNALARLGFTRCGKVYIARAGERIAYQLYKE